MPLSWQSHLESRRRKHLWEDHSSAMAGLDIDLHKIRIWRTLFLRRRESETLKWSATEIENQGYDRGRPFLGEIWFSCFGCLGYAFADEDSPRHFSSNLWLIWKYFRIPNCSLSSLDCSCPVRLQLSPPHPLCPAISLFFRKKGSFVELFQVPTAGIYGPVACCLSKAAKYPLR